MMTFTEYMMMRQAEVQEGLWLADKNAVPGMSKINPFPGTDAQRKALHVKPFKKPKPFAPTIRKVKEIVPNRFVAKIKPAI